MTETELLEHPREIGDRLKYLVEHHWLDRSGQGRGTKYRWPTKQPTDLFAENELKSRRSSEHYQPSSEHYGTNSEHYEELWTIAAPVREKGRTGKELVRQIILKLCKGNYLSLRTLADLLDREPDSIRNHYINPMLKEGLLIPRYPENPNHPHQGYRTAKEVENK